MSRYNEVESSNRLAPTHNEYHAALQRVLDRVDDVLANTPEPHSEPSAITLKRIGGEIRGRTRVTLFISA